MVVIEEVPESGDEAEHDDDAEDSGDDEDGDGSEELVGYLEEPPSPGEQHLLSRQFFPSKLGGRPAWLVPEQLPNIECQRCGNRLRFLLQVYASQGTEKESAFHRVLHVFVCTNCQPNEARVFRAQLPRENRFYSAERPDLEAAKEPGFVKPDSELQALCCRLCGLPCVEAPKICAECARRLRNKDRPAVFVEREISVSGADRPERDEEAEEGADGQAGGGGAEDGEDGEDGDEGEGAGEPGKDAGTGDLSTAAGQEIVPHAEWDCKGDEHAMVRLKAYMEKAASDPEAVLDKSEQKVYEEWCNKQSVKDSTFAYFLKYAAANQSHVLRYELGGSPLWFCGPRQLRKAPPACSRCGAPRVFELQVQPQLIALLAGTTCADRLDFGTICVYSCRESCDAPGEDSAYHEEFVYVQPEPVEEWTPKPS